MPKCHLSRRGADDLKEIAAFTLERWGEEQVERYMGSFEALFHLIANTPMIGRSAARVGSNMRRMEHVSHIVFYKTVPDGVRVVRVLHKNRALKKKDFQ